MCPTIWRHFENVVSEKVSQAEALVIEFLPFVMYTAFLETTRRVIPHMSYVDLFTVMGSCPKQCMPWTLLVSFSQCPTGPFLLRRCKYLYGCGSKCKVWIKPRSHKRSRPLIQTPDPDLSKGVDPDLWSRPLEWYFFGASWCLQFFTLPSSQATNCFKATLPSCQASKLHLLQSHAAKQSSCQAAKLDVLLSHAFKLSNCNCSQATKLSSYQADAVARPGCQAAKVSTCCLHLVVLFLSHCIQAATYTKKWVQF